MVLGGKLGVHGHHIGDPPGVEHFYTLSIENCIVLNGKEE